LEFRYARAERFKEAVKEVTPKENVNVVKEYGPVCWQRVARDLPVAGRSEDCLLLNIWAPQWKIDEVSSGLTNTSLLPIVVWIHGGGFVVGSGTNLVASGHSFARENTILISINYRLGLFGFWKHNELKNSGEKITSNFGLHDQVVALEWIRDNIAQFGGDPSSITVVGESAGAISILHHLTSRRMIEDAKENRPKLFHRAWLMSAVVVETPFLESPLSEVIGAEWAAAKGCEGDQGVVECMRSKTPMELIDPLTRWSAVDHDTNRATIYSMADDEFPLIPVALRAGAFDHHVPVVIGSAMEDGSLFAWFSFPVYGPEKPYLEYVIRRSFGDIGDDVLSLYPSANYASEYWRFTDILTDVAWHCPMEFIASTLSEKGKAPARRYIFNFRFNDSSDLFGIFHCSELPLMFENPSGNYLFPRHFTPAERELSNYFTNVVARFARDQLDEEEWPAYDSTSAKYMLLGNVNTTERTIKEQFRSEQCKFWQTQLPRGILEFPKDIYAEEGWRSNIMNNIFWTFTNYEEHFTQRNGIIALIGSLLCASLVVKLITKASSVIRGTKNV
jgi:para-nitrobenzyl esterase